MVNIKTVKKMDLCGENEVINSIREATQNTPIIVDFDETLFLRNSTAEYLNSLQPRLIGLLLIRAITFIQPWKLFTNKTESAKARDWFLVFLTTLLMPWNLIFWQNKACHMAKEYNNSKLTKEFNQNTNADIIVASLGFNFIILPILRCMPVKYTKLIGCRFWQGLKDRQKNKLTMVQEFIDLDRIASSILITDSLDDLPLLNKVAKPFLILWSEAKYNAPMRDFYFPMMYIHKVKRPGKKYISEAIFGDDIPILLLAFSWLSTQPILHGIGISILIFSFWCIYEYGYYENDVVAEKYEKQPNLSDAYYNSLITMNWWQPWIWALLLGSIGAVFIVASNSLTTWANISFDRFNSAIIYKYAWIFARWVGFLLVLRFCFLVYNYVNKPTRIWFYTILQFCRYCGFLVVTKTNLVGISLLLSQILARSISYMVYRYAGGNQQNWPKIQEKFLRCLLLALFVISLSMTKANLFLIVNWQTATIFTWCFLRGGKHIRQVADICGLIQQDKIKNVT
jgi:hypothetical protein